MSETKRSDNHQRAIAQRNVELILDAAERLLARRREASISAVAAESGISRVTVYGHFRDRSRLIEAVVERTVERAMTEIDKVDPGRGPADEALERVLVAAWEEIGHSGEIGAASASELSAAAMRRAHQASGTRILELAERGRKDGVFRTDVPTEWLVSSFHALIHAARDEVGMGALDSKQALGALVATVPELFRGPG